MVYKDGSIHYNRDGVRYNAALVQLSLFPIIPSLSYSFKF